MIKHQIWRSNRATTLAFAWITLALVLTCVSLIQVNPSSQNKSCTSPKTKASTAPLSSSPAAWASSAPHSAWSSSDVEPGKSEPSTAEPPPLGPTFSSTKASTASKGMLLTKRMWRRRYEGRAVCSTWPRTECRGKKCCSLGVLTRLISMELVIYWTLVLISGSKGLSIHEDPYGRSKSIAEQLVLKYNALPFRKKSNGKCLYTCAIRPAAIYGAGEERHLPRIVSLAKLGLIPFKIGEANVKTDWIYVDNLVLALVLASMGLLHDIPGRGKEKQPIAAGQPYFVSDGSPVNTFEFIRPLLRSLDYDLPKSSLSVPQALHLGRIFWGVYTVFYPWLDRWWIPQPLILPAEVYKVGVTHYFSYLKAKEELGYVPMVTPREGMATTISYWQERKRKTLDGPTIYAWLFCVIGMVRIVYLLATALHVGEAVYAWSLAKKVDPANTRGWFWQTFALGVFSLRLLLKRAK
ncbi:hypothetical protein ACLB2K_052863 [Fragaria x ananassa]